MSVQQKVYELYLLDRQVRGLQTRLDAAQRREVAQQRMLEQLQQQESEMAQQLKQAKVSASGLEHQVKDMDDRITRARDEMNRVRNNKEYSALLIEVNTLKEDRGQVEEQALEQMGLAEQVEAELSGLQAKVAERNKILLKSKEDVIECRAEVGDRLDELSVDRETAAADVPERARGTFERLSDMHEGDALAEVVEESRRNMEYTCGGCFITLPIERLNELMIRSDQLTFCPSCERILRLTDDLRTELAPK
jgi:predicted  nucleic acid-binding Zn-ribbon protein